jgi:hypothetical protein
MARRDFADLQASIEEAIQYRLDIAASTQLLGQRFGHGPLSQR